MNSKLKTDNSGMKSFSHSVILSCISYLHIRNVKYNLCISGFEDTILMQSVRKYLVYKYVPIMEKTFRSGTRDSCVAQRSIYVMLRGNEETRSYINQVRNVLRHLFSDILYFRLLCFLHIIRETIEM